MRRRMSPPHRQSARISEELGIHLMSLYKWRKAWRSQGEVVPVSEMEPEGWNAADKFTVVLESAGQFPEQASRWRQAAQPANTKPVLRMAEKKELGKLRAEDQREINALKMELQHKEKAMAEMAALLVLQKKWDAFCSEEEEG